MAKTQKHHQIFGNYRYILHYIETRVLTVWQSIVGKQKHVWLSKISVSCEGLCIAGPVYHRIIKSLSPLEH